jgi:exopolyphosphatase / guanosine-5'-triphosphate,3'-diphosphate pyrophosphatase
MPVFAAIDIGANSVRLKIARFANRKMQVIFEDREVTRLGESVFRNGLLAPEAMAQTVKVLSRFHRATQRYGVEQLRIVSTSPLRDARNARALTEWVRSVTGWNIQVISGLEEGRLIHLGVLSNMPIANKMVLMFDLGGGSCELTISDHGHIRTMFSLPLGAVRLTQEFLLHDPPKKLEIARMREFIAEEVHRVAGRIRSQELDLAIATSGTAAALDGAARGLEGRSKYSHTVSRKVTLQLAKDLARRTGKEREEYPGIGPRRAEIIVAGAFVFAEMMTHYGLPSFRYSPLGLRDGLLAQMAADWDPRALQRSQLEAERQDALLETCKRYGVDRRYSEHVCELALQLFEALKRLHNLSPEYRQWITAAAMLHEVGSYINRSGRHRHSYYLISNSEIFGFTPEQRTIIAAIARYMGKSRPALDDSFLKKLRVGDRGALPKAVLLLRLARALNQSRRGAVQKITARIQDSNVWLRPVGKRELMDLELWATEKEKGYFREVFGRELLLGPEAA